ncbi:MAG TPA: bifunctional 3'-5' exonuclease/DNA polymerase [Streptosporangiaceae bacterium]|nr:bifunctional 3'-5' exonuclease/DNA polymerase [Streptosporangiaceae bacterium]
MRIAVAADSRGDGLIRRLNDDGTPAAPPEHVAGVADAVAALEREASPRWVWASSARIYPAMLGADVRVASCHDVRLIEAMLLAHRGRFGEEPSLEAALARLRGIASAPGRPAPSAGGAQSELFAIVGDGFASPREELDAVIAVQADQLRRIAAAPRPGRLSLLAAAESAGGLAAAEMMADGLPWRGDIHDELLTELLGPRPAPGLRPRRLVELADAIREALHARALNPDSPAQLVKAFAAEGISLTSTRAHVLRTVDHPAVSLLLEYKELARLHAADGWGWLDTWVSDGRFRPEYVVGGVVSGRWASRGGGALQIPKVLRRAVVADPGYVLVVADAAQLEPRVLAALAGDRAFAEAAAAGDVYAALAGTLGGERDKAKVALLSAMYGGAGGEAGQLLAVLRSRFPAAARYVDDAARAGEEGRLVRSRLGRTCPLPSAQWRQLTGDRADPRAGRALRSRGRFTRNFVVQASAADWAAVLLASLRRRLAATDWPAAEPAGGRAAAGRPHLVFFQHDEVIVHSPAAAADEVVRAARAAAQQAGRLVFGPGPVRFPLNVSVVTCYADAK